MNFGTSEPHEENAGHSAWKTRSEYGNFAANSDQKGKIGSAVSALIRAGDRHILDVGPGSGEILRWVVRCALRHGNNPQLEIVDSAPEIAAMALLDPITGPFVRRIHIGEIEWYQTISSYNIILAIHSLYGCYERHSAEVLCGSIRRLLGSLRPNGRLILSVVAESSNDLLDIRKRLVDPEVRLLTDRVLMDAVAGLGVACAVELVPSKLKVEVADFDWLERFIVGSAYLDRYHAGKLARILQEDPRFLGRRQPNGTAWQLNTDSTLVVLTGNP